MCIITAETNIYDHYRLICLLLIVNEILQKTKKLTSQYPRALCDLIKCLVSSDQQSKT